MYPNRKHYASAFVSPLVSSNSAPSHNTTRMKNRIRELREAAGLSQDALAEKLGTIRGTISKLEQGKMTLSQDWIMRISKVFRCDPGDIISNNKKIGDQAIDEELMKRCVAEVQEAAEEYNMKLTFNEGLNAAVQVYNNTLEFRKRDKEIEPNRVIASLILKSLKMN
jgi:transcriptional regulator with XRE-family HTH domain